MKKYIAQGLMSLAVVLASVVSLAEETTQDDARMAARGWSMLNGKTFGSLGSVKNVLVEKDAQGQVLWYVVVMSGGAAVVAPDTEIEPVIAVMPGSDGVIPKGSPLDAILRRDLANRLQPLRRPPLKLKTATAQAAAPTSGVTKTSSKWDKLRRLSTMKLLNVDGNPATIVRWLDGWNSGRKQNGVQTLRFWNQQGSSNYFTDKLVFNKYTPNNWPCGCVATAGAAIMHYFRAPSGAVLTKTCTVGNQGKDLTTRGGTYDWSLIDDHDLELGNPRTLTAEQLDLLARVAYDCGVGCEMAYGEAGSGSNTCKLQSSFREVFGAEHAQLVTQEGGLYGWGENYDIGPENYEKIIYNQIRGGAPIALGIDGHEVVACGYGFDADETDYTYIFLGWGGQNDTWYALPTVDTKATVEGGWYTSTFIDELITEISFDDKFVAVCGQYVDIDGAPIAGGKLTMGNGEELTTDEHGFWGTRVDPNDPNNWVADEIGERHYFEIGDLAKTTTDGGVASAELAAALPDTMVIQLLNPTIDVYDGNALVRQHGSIDSAVETARDCANPRIVLTDRAALRYDCTIDFSCTISATNVNPLASAVTCGEGATLTVGAGARVLFSNIVFQASAPVVSVATNGTAAFCGKIGIGDVLTADAGGIELAGALESVGDDGLRVRCAVAPDLDQVFGKWTCRWEDAVACAPQFANAVNRRTSGLALADGTMVWQNFVGPGNAVAYRTDGDERVNYAYFEDALTNSPSGSEIVICRNCELPGYEPIQISITNTLSISSDREGGATVTLVGLGGKTEGAFTEGAFVTVTGSLTLENVNFDGRGLTWKNSACSVFYVWDGELILGSGAGISNVAVVDSELDGVISVRSGRLEMRDGSFVSACRDKVDNIKSVALNGATFDFAGGSVVNGNIGIYACSNTTVNVSGSATATGSFDNDGVAFNLTVGEGADLVLAGELTGTVGVQVQDAESSLSNKFGIVSASFSGDPADSAAHFVNDQDRTLIGYATEDRDLIWVEAPPPPLGPVARVTYLSSGETQDFETADAAFAAIRGEAVTVELYRDLAFSNAVEITSDVTLFSTNGVVLTLVPTVSKISNGEALFTVEESSLVISNVTVDAAGDVLYETIMSGTGYVPSLQSVVKVLGYEQGASLTLDNAVITNFCSAYDWSDAAIQVVDGTVALRGGSRLTDCWSMYEGSYCGAIFALRGQVILADCEIDSCRGVRVDGVYLDEDSTLEVSGNAKVEDNFKSTRDVNLFLAYNLLSIAPDAVRLTGDFTGRICLAELPAEGEPTDVGRQFGVVDADYLQAASPLELFASAARFVHETDDDTGRVVTNGTEALLVWSSALENGVYTSAAGEEYRLVDGTMPEPTEIDPPVVVSGLKYNGLVQTGVPESTGYTLTGHKAKDAGNYQAIAKLRTGYVWTGGGTAEVKRNWSIAKATYDMSGVTFEDASFEADGSPKSIEVSGSLPDGVTVTYEGNGQTAPNVYTVTAKFSGDATNYEPIPDMTATLTITPKEDDPEDDPQWTVVTNQPSPIAFKSIERVSDTKWTLVITDRVEFCNYRLIYTDDLTKGFTVTGAWEQAHAAGSWTTNVITTGGAWFWRAEGTEGTNMVPPEVVAP